MVTSSSAVQHLGGHHTQPGDRRDRLSKRCQEVLLRTKGAKVQIPQVGTYKNVASRLPGSQCSAPSHVLPRKSESNREHYFRECPQTRLALPPCLSSRLVLRPVEVSDRELRRRRDRCDHGVAFRGLVGSVGSTTGIETDTVVGVSTRGGTVGTTGTSKETVGTITAATGTTTGDGFPDGTSDAGGTEMGVRPPVVVTVGMMTVAVVVVATGCTVVVTVFHADTTPVSITGIAAWM